MQGDLHKHCTCSLHLVEERGLIGVGDFAELVELLAEDTQYLPQWSDLDEEQKRVAEAVLKLRELAFAARDYAVASQRYRKTARLEDRERCLQLDEHLVATALPARAVAS